MGKVHKLEEVCFIGTTLNMVVDGMRYEIDIAARSERLARATAEQRNSFILSPSGYGIHWPDLDEDLSIDGLIGVKHAHPALAETA